MISEQLIKEAFSAGYKAGKTSLKENIQVINGKRYDVHTNDEFEELDNFSGRDCLEYISNWMDKHVVDDDVFIGEDLDILRRIVGRLRVLDYNGERSYRPKDTVVSKDLLQH